jgi:uncharacterized delta-60 repeat protein
MNLYTILRRAFIAIFFIVSFSFSSRAQHASVDSSFGSHGYVGTPLAGGFMTDSKVLPNDKILCVGYATMATSHSLYLTRYQPDGSLDSSFGSNGIVVDSVANDTSLASRSLLIESSGKVLVTGMVVISGVVYLAVWRFDASGHIDSTYGTYGRAIASGNQITLPIAMHYDDNGGAGVIQHDDKVVVGANAMGSRNHDFFLVRFKTNGSLDSTFGTNGKVIQMIDTTTGIYNGEEAINAMTIQPDGKIIAIGSTSYDNSSYTLRLEEMARFNTNGSLDVSFAQQGKYVQSHRFSSQFSKWLGAVAIQPNGNIVVAGTIEDVVPGTSNIYIIELDHLGSGVNFVNLGGPYYNVSSSLLITPNNKVVLGGGSGGFSASFSTNRLQPNLQIDTFFNGYQSYGPTVWQPNNIPGTVAAVSIQSTGKIILAGGGFSIIRILPGLDTLACPIPITGLNESSPFICPSTSSDTLTCICLFTDSNTIYHWYKNNMAVGTNSNIYVAIGLNAGDSIWASVTNNTNCYGPQTVYSYKFFVTADTTVIPSVSVAASQNGFCGSVRDTFIATPVNGGSTPSYQWYKNGMTVGTNARTFITSTLANNDSIWVVMTSNAPCASPAIKASNKVYMNITHTSTPSVSVSASATSFCTTASADTFQAIPTFGGSAPAYHWYKNGTTVGTNSPLYIDPSPANNDSVWVTMTSNAACVNPLRATSARIYIHMSSSLTPLVSIAATRLSSCASSSTDTFTARATNGGSIPTYQWYVNGVQTGLNSATYVDNNLHNRDSIWVVMNSSLSCASPAMATSSPTVIVVNPLPPQPHITRNGTTLSVTATGHLQWLYNGLPQSGDTTSSITVTQNGAYTLTVTDANGCSSISDTMQIAHLSITDLIAEHVRIYPNPSSGSFTLETNHMIGEDYIITDMLGQIVQEKTITSDRQHIDMSTSAPGVYTLILRGKSGAVRVVVR